MLSDKIHVPPPAPPHGAGTDGAPPPPLPPRWCRRPPRRPRARRPRPPRRRALPPGAALSLGRTASRNWARSSSAQRPGPGRRAADSAVELQDLHGLCGHGTAAGCAAVTNSCTKTAKKTSRKRLGSIAPPSVGRSRRRQPHQPDTHAPANPRRQAPTAVGGNPLL